MSDAESDVNVCLTSDEAWFALTGYIDVKTRAGCLSLPMGGERTALFNLSALLERELVEPFQQNYAELVDRSEFALPARNKQPSGV